MQALRKRVIQSVSAALHGWHFGNGEAIWGQEGVAMEENKLCHRVNLPRVGCGPT